MGTLFVNKSGRAFKITRTNGGSDVIGTLPVNAIFAWTDSWAGNGTLRDALAAALYSGKHPGVDERLDDGSTDIDTLDAYEYTIERDFKRLTNT